MFSRLRTSSQTFAFLSIHSIFQKRSFQMISLINLNSKSLRKGDPEPVDLSPGQVQVFNMRFCPWAERAILTLSFKGIPAEVVNINLGSKPEWYLSRIHPEGKVPALKIDDEITVDSGLIPEYLDFKYPQKPILPSDPFLRFQQKLLVEQLASPLASTLYRLMAVIGYESKTEEVFKSIKEIFIKAENLLTGRFYGGDQVAYADLMLFPFFERYYWTTALGNIPFDLHNFPGKDEYPKLTEYFRTIYSLPEIKGVVQSVEAYKAFLRNYKAGDNYYEKVDYDAGI